MRFSIVTPVRNRLTSLKRCVGSVRGQSAVDLEHVIQDCVSNDGTSAWLAQQADLSWRSESDGGMYDAINRGWARASGDVLSWLNSDEQYLPGTLEHVARVFAEHPEVEVVWGDVIVVDADGEAVAARREIPLRSMYLANGFLNAYSCATFFRRGLWEKGLLRLNNGYRYAADLDLIMRLMRSGVRFLHVPSYLSLFQIDGSNLSTHSGMESETLSIQAQYGGFTVKPLRRAVMMARYVERAMRGSYRPVSLNFQYALDEIPTYVRRHAVSISGRYRIPDTGDTKALHG